MARTGSIIGRKNGAAKNVDLSSIDDIGERGGAWIPKKADYDTIREAASMQCTQPEIAAMVGISCKTLEKILQRARNFDPNKKPTKQEAVALKILHEIEDGREYGKSSLRASQYRLAVEKENVQMSIHLGKQYLGQSEKQELTGKDGLPLNQPPEVVVNFVGASEKDQLPSGG